MKRTTGIVWRGAALLASFSLVFSAAALAQLNTGNIAGTVTDQTGAVTPGASITIKNIENAIVDRGFAEGWITPQVPEQRTGILT